MPLDFVNMIQTGGFVGLLIILAFPSLRKKFGFGNGNNVDSEQLAQVLKSVLVDDEQSPILVKSRIKRICDDINTIKQDIILIKGILDK